MNNDNLKFNCFFIYSVALLISANTVANILQVINVDMLTTYIEQVSAMIKSFPHILDNFWYVAALFLPIWLLNTRKQQGNKKQPFNSKGSGNHSRETLRKYLVNKLSKEEILAICFDLHIDFENFNNKKSLLVIELLLQLDRKDQLHQLKEWLEINGFDIREVE